MKSKNSLLTCLKKRDILNRDEIDSQTLVDYGSRYLGSELLNDALDFFEKAQHSEGISKIKDLAIQSADLFLYKRCCSILGKKENKKELLELAERAISYGKISFASQVYEILGETSKAKALKDGLSEDIPVSGNA